MVTFLGLPFLFLLFGDTTIANANKTAETITIEAPIGKSVTSESQKPMRQPIIPTIGEKIMIFLSTK